MASRDDEYWHQIMILLSEEYEGKAAWEEGHGHVHEAKAWREAATELRLTANQALETNTVAERLVHHD